MIVKLPLRIIGLGFLNNSSSCHQLLLVSQPWTELESIDSSGGDCSIHGLIVGVLLKEEDATHHVSTALLKYSFHKFLSILYNDLTLRQRIYYLLYLYLLLFFNKF